MTIDLMNSTGQQIEMTIDEFAQALSKGMVYGLAIRYYNAPTFTNVVLGVLSKHDYNAKTWQPDPVKLADYIRSLDEINEEYEYTIGYAPQCPVRKYQNMTFTRSDDMVTVEFY